MACTYIYNGQSFTEKQMISLIKSGEFDSLHFEGFAVEKKTVSQDEASKILEEQAKKNTLSEEITRIRDQFKDWVVGETEVDGKSISNVYQRGTTKVHRITDKVQGFINKFRRKPYTGYDYDFAQIEADIIWGPKNVDEKLNTHLSSVPLNKAEYISLLREAVDRGVARGTIMHKIIEYYLNNDPAKKYDIQQELTELMFTYGFEDWEFKWVDKHHKDILARAGINVMEDKLANELRDEVVTEVKVISEELGFGGTADILVRHSDGTYSLIDLKTGSRFNLIQSSQIFKFGRRNNIDIYQSPRETAKLQIMLYALMFKINNPTMQFRDLQVLWVPNKSFIESGMIDHNRFVEVREYLGMIHDYLYDEYKKSSNPDNTAYGKLKQLPHFDKLFKVSEYVKGYDTSVYKNTLISGKSPVQQYAFLMKELRKTTMFNVNKYKDSTSHAHVKAVQDAQKIMDQLLKLKKEANISDMSWDKDISWMSYTFGSGPDIHNPYIQSFNRMLVDRKKKANAKYEKWKSQWIAYVKPVIELYYQRSDTGFKPLTEGLPITKGLLNNIDPHKMWEWIYKVEKDKETGMYIRNSLNVTEQDWAAAIQEFPYLEDGNTGKVKKEYLDLANFVMDSYDQFFLDEKSLSIDPETGKKQAVANRIVSKYRDHKGEWQELSNIDLATSGGPITTQRKTKWKYQRGFFAKVAKTPEEFGIFRMFDPEYRRELFKRWFTWHNEDVFNQLFNQDEAIPMIGLGNEYINNSQNFSIDIEEQLVRFVKHHYMKEELDDVYAFGKGLSYYLKTKNDPTRNKSMNRTIEWLEKAIEMFVRGRRDESLRSSFTDRTFSVTSQRTGKSYKLDWLKVLYTIKTSTSKSIMWLRVVAGTANGVFAYMYTVKEAVKNSLYNRFVAKNEVGVDSDPWAFGVSDVLKGTALWFDLQKDAMMGNLHKNKMFMLAKHLNYLPNNFDYSEPSTALVTRRNRNFSSSSLYAFHSIPEEMIALTTMAAQLNRIKIKSKDEHNGKSLWDMYHVVEEVDENGIKHTSIKWGVEKDGKIENYVRGYTNTSKDPNNPVYQEISELSTEELRRMYYVYQRMHGGYRSDELTIMEYTIWGQLFMQFKRYMPAILRNAFMSKGENLPSGWWVYEGGEFEGKAVMDWHARVIEGRWTFLGGLLMQWTGIKGSHLIANTKLGKFLGISGIEATTLYDEKNLTEFQKDVLLDLFTTMTFFLFMYLGYIALFGGGAQDDDDPLMKYYQRIQFNFIQQWYVPEMMRDLVKNGWPASARTLYKQIESIGEMTIASAWAISGDDEKAFTKNGELRGFRNFQKVNKYMHGWRDIIDILNSAEDPENLLYRAAK